MLSHAHIPSKYWVDACQTATYIINRLPTRVLGNMSPYEKLFCRKPNYDFFKVFGCRCFPWLRPYTQNKLEPKSKSCVFLGYSLDHQGINVWIYPRRVYLSRHALFDEDYFPFQDSTPPRENVTLGNNSNPDLLFVFPNISHPSPINSHSQLEAVCQSPLPASTPNTTLPLTESVSQPSPPESTCLTVVPPNPTTSVLPLGLPTEQESDPEPVHQSQSMCESPPVHSMTTCSKDGIRKPNPKYALHVVTNDPTCFSQAVKKEEWRDVMVKEFNALQRCGTWNLVPYRPNMNLLPKKWVYKIKRRADGSIERHKARLVANGFHQKEGVDYGETFSPVVKHSMIRLVLSLAVSKHWPVRQLDVQ